MFAVVGEFIVFIVAFPVRRRDFTIWSSIKLWIYAQRRERSRGSLFAGFMAPNRFSVAALATFVYSGGLKTAATETHAWRLYAGMFSFLSAVCWSVFRRRREAMNQDLSFEVTRNLLLIYALLGVLLLFFSACILK